MALTQARKTAKVTVEMLALKACLASLIAQADEWIDEITPLITAYQIQRDDAANVLAELEKAYPAPVEKEV